jgi:hypothetical protein
VPPVARLPGRDHPVQFTQRQGPGVHPDNAPIFERPKDRIDRFGGFGRRFVGYRFGLIGFAGVDFARFDRFARVVSMNAST